MFRIRGSSFWIRFLQGRADGNGIDDSADHPGTGFGRLPGADSDYDFCRIEDQRDLQKRFSVITASYVMSTVLGFFSADCHMAIVLTSNAMGRRFDELGIHKCVLARTVHDGATGLAPLVPWTTAGVYFSATLGVAAAEYVPYYMLALTMTAATLFFAATGMTIRYSKE